jgi:hypothetical protein
MSAIHQGLEGVGGRVDSPKSAPHSKVAAVNSHCKKRLCRGSLQQNEHTVWSRYRSHKKRILHLSDRPINAWAGTHAGMVTKIAMTGTVAKPGQSDLGMRPTWSETCLTAATTRPERCCSGRKSFSISLLSLACSEGAWPWYLPVSRQCVGTSRSGATKVVV